MLSFFSTFSSIYNAHCVSYFYLSSSFCKIPMHFHKLHSHCQYSNDSVDLVVVDKAQGHGLHQNKGLCEVELSASVYSGKAHGKGIYCT